MPAKEIPSRNYPSSIPSYMCVCIVVVRAFLWDVGFVMSAHTNKQCREMSYKQHKTYISLSINIKGIKLNVSLWDNDGLKSDSYFWVQGFGNLPAFGCNLRKGHRIPKLFTLAFVSLNIWVYSLDSSDSF